MPYTTNKELPSTVRNALPDAAQAVYRNAFNSAKGKGATDEDAFRQAWGAVKNAGYTKGKDGTWEKEQAQSPQLTDALYWKWLEHRRLTG